MNCAAPFASSSRKPQRVISRSLTQSGRLVAAAKLRVRRQIVLRQHLLEPHRLEFLERLRDADRRRQVPVAVELHGDFDVVAELGADLAQRLAALPQLLPS